MDIGSYSNMVIGIREMHFSAFPLIRFISEIVRFLFGLYLCYLHLY